VHPRANIAAVILAAGNSFRFGKPKQLQLFRGKTLLQRTIDAATDANCSPIVVVIGSDPDKITSALKATNATLVYNYDWKRGIGTSIRTGIQFIVNAGADIEVVALLVCDQPFVDATLIRKLVALRAKTGKSIVASSYADTLGVPALFDHQRFSELLALDDNSGAKSVILLNRGRVAEFPFPDAAIDVDTAEDWDRLENLIATEE
jgi:molybdenum cofactor cytidylyltransferase